MQRKFSMVKKGSLPAQAKGRDDLYDVAFSMPTSHSLDDVWGALVKPEKLALWMRPVSGKMAKGAEIAIAGLAEAKITVCEPKRRLALTFTRGDSVQDLDITFGETGKGKSKTRLVHVKVTARISDLPSGVWAEKGPAVVAIGWELVCKSLVDYLDSPKAPPAAGAFAIFAASAEGRGYLDEAVSGWREAAAAGGLDAAQMAKAQPTLLGVYTGLHP